MGVSISGKTKLLCLLGSPVAHSISPKMHTLAAEALGLDYAYLAFDVPEDEIAHAVDAMRLLSALGFNLTMPLKQAVIPYLDELSDAARLSGSVNTVVNEDGRLVGHTTDGTGYMDSLRDGGIDIKGQKMTLLGFGGAARSIIAQAALDGVSAIDIFKRKNSSFGEACEFAEHISKETDCRVKAFDISDRDMLSESIATSGVLTNTTPVGMAGNSEGTSLVPKEFLRKELIVSDIIYHPSMTRLLYDAAEVGAKYINGKFMLLFQGAAAFKLWTGADMPIETIRSECFCEEN